MQTPTTVDAIERINKIFMPPFWERKVALRDSKRVLVHYTSAENAIRILSGQSILLRSTVCMNDYSEVQHGHNLVYRSFTENDRSLLKKFTLAFDPVQESAAAEAFDRYDKAFKDHVFRIFIACLSEHDQIGDNLGRLSMWRAYNQGSSGVAIVLDKSPFFNMTTRFFGFYASPVAYLRDYEVRNAIELTIERAIQEREFLRTLPREALINMIFVMLLFSSICIKHHGFEEEREWRIIYLPWLAESKYLKSETLSISGVPQIVYRLALKDDPSEGLVGIEIKNFVREIITGPSNFPFPIHEAIADALRTAGVQNPHAIIRPSTIPLRM